MKQDKESHVPIFEKAFQHLVDFLHIFKGQLILVKYLEQLSINPRKCYT